MTVLTEAQSFPVLGIQPMPGPIAIFTAIVHGQNIRIVRKIARYAESQASSTKISD